MTKNRLVLSVALLVGLSCGLSARAHRLNVFAYPEANQICVESSFAGGRPAMNSPVVFLDEHGKEFLRGKTSPKGKICVKLPEDFVAQPVTVIVNAGEGHQNRWEIRKEDFPLGIQASAIETLPAIKREVQAESPAGAQEPKLYTQKELEEAVRAAREEVETKVAAPLRRELAQAKEPKISWRDIFGGIGWLIGLGGLFAWITTRRPKKK